MQGDIGRYEALALGDLHHLQLGGDAHLVQEGLDARVLVRVRVRVRVRVS